jgi:hypothetical protein
MTDGQVISVKCYLEAVSTQADRQRAVTPWPQSPLGKKVNRKQHVPGLIRRSCWPRNWAISEQAALSPSGEPRAVGELARDRGFEIVGRITPCRLGFFDEGRSCPVRVAHEAAIGGGGSAFGAWRWAR